MSVEYSPRAGISITYSTTMIEPTLAPGRGLVTRRSADQVKLRELHIGGNVDPPACGPAVGHVLSSVANYDKQVIQRYVCLTYRSNIAKGLQF